MRIFAYILLGICLFALLYAIVQTYWKKQTVKDIFLARFEVFFWLFAIAFSVVILKIVVLQEEPRRSTLIKLRETTQRTDSIFAKRGNILSDDGRLMAASLPTYYISMDMGAEALSATNKEGKVYFMEHVHALADSLHARFGEYSTERYEKQLREAYQNRHKHRIYRILRKPVGYADFMDIKNTFPILNRTPTRGGVMGDVRMSRVKPFETLATRTIGNIYGKHKNMGGQFGLELSYDSVLRGKNGLKEIRRAAGRNVDVILKEPIDGKDIVTTINIDLQETAEDALRTMLTQLDARYGTAVLMECKTGDIKAIANLSRGKDGLYHETEDIATASMVEPGSTFKTLSFLVALEDGVIDTTTTVDTYGGVYKFANRYMRDWKQGGFGRLSVPEVLYQSSNVGVSWLIEEHYHRQPSRFVEGIHRTGFDTPIKLEIPGYGKVRLKRPGDKYWWGTSLPWMSIGYELQIPPIYTLMFYNAIANDGCMVAPRFVRAIQENGTTVQEMPIMVVNEKICSAKTLGKLQAMLRGVVEKGTAKAVRSPLFSIAGKTGTSQVSENGRYKDAHGRVMHQVTFCGYFPADHPMYSCIVYIREPLHGAHAGPDCGAVFRAMAEKAFIQSTEAAPKADPWMNGNGPVDPRKALAAKRVILHPEENNRMPELTGLTAADAAYLLSNQGIEVRLSGSGRVTSQSLPAGSPIREGMSCHLYLE